MVASHNFHMCCTQGEQVFISYGRQSNDSLLQYYGFVEPGNPHDTYVIPDLSRSALLRHSTKAASNLPAALLSAKPEVCQSKIVMMYRSCCTYCTMMVSAHAQVVLTRQGPDSKTMERLRGGGLSDSQISQVSEWALPCVYMDVAFDAQCMHDRHERHVAFSACRW